jgi:hypothetical protein
MTVWSTFGRRLVALPGVSAFTTFIGLGTAAFKDTGTSGNTVPLLDGANTWSAAQGINSTLWVGSGGALIGSFTVHTATNKNFYVANNFNLSTGVAFGSINDANNALQGMEFRASEILFTGGSTFGNWVSRRAPVTKTADFTVATTENWLINNKSGSTCTVTLPAAASFSGREIMFKNSQAQTVVSASSNVVPRVTAAAGTAILASGSGNWCVMVSDGTNRVIMAGS